MKRSSIKHHAILDAAIEVADRDGYAGATIEAIAAVAGVGKQTIYRWWPSKSALFIEVYEYLVDRRFLAARTGNLSSELTELLQNLFRIYRQTPAGRVLVGLVAEASANADIRNVLSAGIVAGRAEIVTDLVRKHAPPIVGELPGIDPEIVNEVLVALVWKRLAIAPDRLDDEAAAEIAGIALAAARRESVL
ncbi:MAG: TetR/AcrR family transcriptional regulator [Pseudomonadota bacterium]